VRIIETYRRTGGGEQRYSEKGHEKQLREYAREEE
jgi:hypothetical protein